MARIAPEAEAEREEEEEEEEKEEEEEDEEETSPSFILASSRGRRKIADRRGSLNSTERGTVKCGNLTYRTSEKMILIIRARMASCGVACAHMRDGGFPLWKTGEGGTFGDIYPATTTEWLAPRIETGEPLITTDIHRR